MSVQAVLMSGDLIVQPLNEDYSAASDFVDMGFADKLEIKVASDLKEMTSKGIGKYGQVIASVAIPKPAELSVEMSQLTNQNLASALMGTLTTTVQTSGNATLEPHTATKGMSFALLHRAVSSVVVKDATDTTTYVSGTDYTVNTALGIVSVITSGAITSASTVHVSYSYAASTLDQILGSTMSQVKWNIILQGKNLVDGRDMIVRIPRALLTPNGAIDFMASGFMSLKMSGRMLVPPGASAPFTLEMSQ